MHDWSTSAPSIDRKKQTIEKECGSNLSSRLWGGALRDETQNSCEGDYKQLGPGGLGLFSTQLPNLIDELHLVKEWHLNQFSLAADSDIAPLMCQTLKIFIHVNYPFLLVLVIHSKPHTVISHR